MNTDFAETAVVVPTELVLPPHWRGEEIGQPDSRARPAVWKSPNGWRWGYETDVGQCLVSADGVAPLAEATERAQRVTAEACL